MNNQDYHVHHGQTFLTLQESLLTNFQLIRKDIADHPRIQMKNLVFPPLTTVGGRWSSCRTDHPELQNSIDHRSIYIYPDRQKILTSWNPASHQKLRLRRDKLTLEVSKTI